MQTFCRLSTFRTRSYPIVRHHHENWDGSGYPDGLAGTSIPLGARILSVVDCFDALTSDRPYRPRLADREAIQILQDRSGSMYDPSVVDTFLRVHGDIAPNVADLVSPLPLRTLQWRRTACQSNIHGSPALGRDHLRLRRDADTVRSRSRIEQPDERSGRRRCDRQAPSPVGPNVAAGLLFATIPTQMSWSRFMLLANMPV